jgi:tetratricopeptide (TPR) repeat protein
MRQRGVHRLLFSLFIPLFLISGRSFGQSDADLINSAELYIQNKDWSQSIAILDKLYEDRPQESMPVEVYFDLVYKLAYSYWQQGHLIKARQLFVEAVDLKQSQGQTRDSDFYTTKINLGGVLQDLGDYQQSLQLLNESKTSIERSLGKGDVYVQALLSLGDLHDLMGNTSESVFHYEEGLKTLTQTDQIGTALYGEVKSSLGRV